MMVAGPCLGDLDAMISINAIIILIRSHLTNATSLVRFDALNVSTLLHCLRRPSVPTASLELFNLPREPRHNRDIQNFIGCSEFHIWIGTLCSFSPFVSLIYARRLRGFIRFILKLTLVFLLCPDVLEKIAFGSSILSLQGIRIFVEQELVRVTRPQ